MELLEKMLEVETQARELIENAQTEATAIRKKARDDAQKMIIDGRKTMHERLQQEIAELEREAQNSKDLKLQETERQLSALRQQAGERMEDAIEQVVRMLVKIPKIPEQGTTE